MSLIPPDPDPHAAPGGRGASDRTTPRQWAGLAVFLLCVFAFGGAMGWLAKRGLDRGAISVSLKHTSHSAEFSRSEEPVGFWIAVGVYAGAGLASGGFALWLLAAALRDSKGIERHPNPRDP